MASFGEPPFPFHPIFAEGWGQNSTGAFIRFLKIAHGSLTEAETQIIISHRLGYISDATKTKVLEETTIERKMLLALIRSIEKRSR